MRLLPWLAATLLGVSLSLPASASLYRVTVDTSGLLGTSGYLAFDFLAGDGAPGNSARVSGFGTDGVLGTATQTGDVTGSLLPGPLTLGGGGQFFSEWLQSVSSFGRTLSYLLDLDTPIAPGARADQWAFFLLDTQQLPIDTTDPTGAGALVFFDLDRPQPEAVVFAAGAASATVTRVVAGVPEPGVLPLALAALALMAGLGSTSARRRSPG